MTREYTPDRWTVIQLKNAAGEQHFRILGSWYGGFAGSDSWKMSSGITKVEEEEHHYQVHNVSGSVYACRKGAQGMSGFTSGVFLSFQKSMREAGGDMMEVANIADVKL